jgi:uncharacterized protein (DUF2147 family)
MQKSMLNLLVFLLAGSAALQAQGSRVEADAVLGHWVTEEGKAHVEIYRCGDAYCGKIVWLREPTKEGKVVLDDKNPDQKMRDQPILGMVMMYDFRYDGDGEYAGGKIYDAESGDTYSAKIELEGEAVVHLRGYILVPLFGRTTTWTRFRDQRQDQPAGDQKR